MRGKPHRPKERGGTPGITPADAGKTIIIIIVNPFVKDHPRGCGENMASVNIGIGHAGSPPRMRGKPTAFTWALNQAGITPADAGKTPFVAMLEPKHRDHPRKCGENSGKSISAHASTESPPQVRGKPARIEAAEPLSRITPASAGKTAIPRSSSCRASDHPRKCGENSMTSMRDRLKHGSPPQVRGKHNFTEFSCKVIRITPAGAGKTRRGTAGAVQTKDHPRRCGENLTASSSSLAWTGSPPQVRGKPSPPFSEGHF